MSAENLNSLSQQLLEITKQMLNSGKPFSIRLSMSGFTYSASSHIKETPDQYAKNKKYKSPSHTNCDYLRKQKFLRQKLDPQQCTEDSETDLTFKCDHCDYTNAKKRGLDTDMRQKHKDASILKQPLQPPEKLRDSSPVTSLLVTPAKDDRIKKCWNCEEELHPSHQWETDEEKMECVNCHDCHWPDYVFCYDPRSEEHKCWCIESCETHCA